MKCIKIQGKFNNKDAFSVASTNMLIEDSTTYDAWNTITNVLRFISDDSNVGFPYTFPFNF